MAMAMAVCKDPPSCGNEMAGLRAFLRSRCGSLKAAFAKLDSHDVGQLTSDDFVKGLRRLGYTEDAAALFRSIDGSKTGLLTMKSFMHFLGDRILDEVERQGSKTMSRSSSEDAWKSCRIPKSPSSTPNLLTGSPVGNALKSGAALRSPTPEQPGLAPHLQVAGADLLYARVARMEEQLAAEQRLRCETEQRLTQHLNSLVGVSISEQLDVLRQQLVEERMQRQVNITALRASVETVRSMALRSVQENLEECVKSEVDKSIGEVRLSLETTNLVKKGPADVQKLEELAKCMEGRLASIEKGESAKAFEERLELLSSNVDLLTSNVELQAKQSLQLKEDVSALQCADIKVHENGETSSFEKVQDYVREKMDRLRVEWSGALEEERLRTMERSSKLTQALTEEFERSILAQAVAEARTEARVAVKDLEPKNGLQQAVLQLGQDIEALWQKLQGKAQGGLAEATRAAEKLCQEKMAVTDVALKTQAEALEHLQQKLNLIEESVRTKLQALVNKMDSKCLEGLVPVLADLGSALKERPKLLETSWCSHSTSSGECSRRTGGLGSPPAPPASQVLRQSSVRSLEESQQIDVLFQENLRLREGELRLREQNLEIRERAMRLQEAVGPVGERPVGSARSQSPPAKPLGSVASPPPMRQQRRSVPAAAAGCAAAPSGPAGMARVMASPPVVTRGMDCRTAPVDRRVMPPQPMNRRAPSPAQMMPQVQECICPGAQPGQPCARPCHR